MHAPGECHTSIGDDSILLSHWSDWSRGLRRAGGCRSHASRGPRRGRVRAPAAGGGPAEPGSRGPERGPITKTHKKVLCETPLTNGPTKSATRLQRTTNKAACTPLPLWALGGGDMKNKRAPDAQTSSRVRSPTTVSCNDVQLYRTIQFSIEKL